MTVLADVHPHPFFSICGDPQPVEVVHDTRDVGRHQGDGFPVVAKADTTLILGELAVRYR